MEALNAKSVTCMSVMERLGGVCAAGASPRDECRNQHKNLNKHTEYTPVTLCPDRTSSRPPKHAASRFPKHIPRDTPPQNAPQVLLRERERDPSPHLALHRVFTPHTTHTLYTPCTDTTKTIPPPSRPRIHGCRQPVACEMMRVGILINYLASAGMLALGSAAHE